MHSEPIVAVSDSGAQSRAAVSKPWWSMRSGPERDAAKKKALAEKTATRVEALPNAIVHFVDTLGNHWVQGASLRRHYFTPGDDAQFRVACLAARTYCKPLTDFRPKIIHGVLNLIVGSKAFPILSETFVMPFNAALKEAEAYLKQTRVREPAARVEHLQGENNK